MRITIELPDDQKEAIDEAFPDGLEDGLVAFVGRQVINHALRKRAEAANEEATVTAAAFGIDPPAGPGGPAAQARRARRQAISVT